MIKIGIIGSNTKKNNMEYVDFIVCKRMSSVNIINRNRMLLCANYVQVQKNYAYNKRSSNTDPAPLVAPVVLT
jgi:hypothetical protein